MSTDPKIIARRSVQGTLLNAKASSITLITGFARLVLLARLLLPEHFGVITLALFFLSLTSVIRTFGPLQAFIQQQEDSERHIATFTTLRVGLTAVAILLTFLIAPLLQFFYPDQPSLVPVLLVCALFELLRSFNDVAEATLRRKLQFRRLSILDVSGSITMTVVAPAAALAGAGVWALVVERVVGQVIRLFGLWVYRPPLKLSFAVDLQLLRWYFNFGRFVFLNYNLNFLLNRFDDFWVGSILGSSALGYYSRAFESARFPRRILSAPLLDVFFPAFARLQGDREALSKAFFRLCSLIVRMGFLLFGGLALAAPEFVAVVLGEKWLPMVVALQLMLVYMLFDPLSAACANLITALGHPDQNTGIRLAQVICFVPSVILLGHLFGINGVAVAADLMLALGLVLSLRVIRRFVDFSLWRLFFVPTLSLTSAVGAATAVTSWVGYASDWTSLLVKLASMTAVYVSISWAMEKQEYLRAVDLFKHHLSPSQKQ